LLIWHMKSKRIVGIGLALAMLTSIAACSGEPLSTREKGTLLGGAAGAGAGALVGSAAGHPGAGAAIGGVGGAAAGYGIGNHMQNEQDQQYYNRGY
jgi:osmotically inducible lipoprotein OsmB